MRSTWYVLEDGSTVDPNECAPDDKGVMRHKDGVAVAMRGNALSSRGVDLDDLPTRELKPEKPKATYKTRDLKSGK